jgi:NADH-quinone oxidoreductase subunit J
MILQDPAAGQEIPDFYLAPQALGEVLFSRYAMAVEMVSFQLLFATIGAFLLGRPLPKGEDQ